jgi:phage terminase large subunit-like protein
MSVELERYLVPVEGELAFIRDHIVLSNGRTLGDVLAHDPWIEQDFLGPVFERDEAGLPRHRLCYLEVARGHWKSGGGAAIAVTEALLHASTDVVVAAGSFDQAKIVTENLAGYLARSPGLRGAFKRRGEEWTVPARHSRIRVISSDAPSAWGLGGTHRRFRLIADELTNWRSDDLWIALASAGGKVPDAQTIVVTNSGFGPGTSWQWRVREAARRESWGYLFSPKGTIASWISTEWIEQMRILLPGPAFDRAIGNVWAAESGDFVTREQWRRCIEPGLRPQTAGSGSRVYYGGLDLGLTRDKTALAIVHPFGDQVVLDELAVWTGTRADPVDISVIERAVADARRRYRTLRVVADPWQLKGSIQRLRGQGVRIKGFTFSGTSVSRLSSVLYEAISSGSLRVYEDDELQREVLGLQVVQGGSGWRFDHQAGGFSDRAVAIAMALSEAVKTGKVMARFSSPAHITLPGVAGVPGSDSAAVLADRLGVSLWSPDSDPLQP